MMNKAAPGLAVAVCGLAAPGVAGLGALGVAGPAWVEPQGSTGVKGGGVVANIIIVAVLILGIFGFQVIAGFEKRMLAGKSGRSAASGPGIHAGSARSRRRRARKHGGD